MEIEKHFTNSFVTFRIKELNDSLDETSNESEKIIGLVKECFSTGHKKIAFQFSHESNSNGWSLGVVTLLSGYFKQEGGEIAIIEAEPSLQEKWNPLITAFGIRVLPSIEALCETRC